MSFFNKMRSFPEWHDMADQLDTAIKSRKKYMENYNSSIGDSYVEFVRKQPLEINDILFRINDKQKPIIEYHKNELSAIQSLRNDIEKLRPINDDIRAKKKFHEKLIDQSERSQKASEKADQKAGNLRTSCPGTPDYQKAEDAAELARKQMETDKATLEDSERKMKFENAEYKKRLFLQLLSSISQYASARNNVCAPQADIGEELKENGKQVPNYNDSSVDKLKTRLQTLRAEPIE